MKVYTVSNHKYSVTVVANSKAKAEDFVRENSLVILTMDGFLKVEIDNFSKIKSFKVDKDSEWLTAILIATYSKKEFEVDGIYN